MKHTNWVRRMEHMVLRVASFVFSVVSAHAILWFFSALNHVDRLQPYVTWGIALGFGVLGYFVSRGLAHRLMNHEPVRAYIFICGVFELVEVVCNYAMAAVAVQWINWLGLVPTAQRSILTFLTYLVLSIIPVVTVMLAWVDMDLDRAKQGYEVRGFGLRSAAPAAPMSGYGAARAPVQTVQPKAAPASVTNAPGAGLSPLATYQSGYTGANPGMLSPAAGQVPTPVMTADQGAASTSWRQRLPFGLGRVGAQTQQ
ncbi:MAG TPA: hypothetical protein VKT25_05240 [Ktedonobacteraceae bacterium]|nr:hypothetical protein [Ktedonobacteraceae bacterium]